MDKDDLEMLFRCAMQFMRHIAKKYGFTIKAFTPELQRAGGKES